MLEFKGKNDCRSTGPVIPKIEVHLWIRDIKLIFAAGYYTDRL
jgi:hypothetical protein